MKIRGGDSEAGSGFPAGAGRIWHRKIKTNKAGADKNMNHSRPIFNVNTICIF